MLLPGIAGGSRSVDPETTFQQFEHHISPITGIVKYVKQLPTPNSLIKAYSAGHNLRPISNQDIDLPAYMRDQSSGKGTTDAQAKTSALCEALERYSGIFQGNEPMRVSSLIDLAGEGIDPNRCMHFSENQYATRDEWHQSCDHLFQRVPERFAPSARMSWTPVWSLVNNHTRYLPTAYCYYNYSGPCANQSRADSNGNAAGNTIEEAILQGFYEVVERDCVSMWWYNRLSRPAVDLASFQQPYFDAVVAYYQSIQRDVWVLDLTADLPVPAFVAISRRIDHPAEDVIFGFGAHLDSRCSNSARPYGTQPALPLRVIEKRRRINRLPLYRRIRAKMVDRGDACQQSLPCPWP